MIRVRLEEEKLFAFVLQFLLNGLLAFLIKKEVVQLAASNFSSLKKILAMLKKQALWGETRGQMQILLHPADLCHVWGVTSVAILI